VTRISLVGLIVALVSFGQTAAPPTAPTNQQIAIPPSTHRAKKRDSDLPLQLTREAAVPENAQHALSLSEISIDTGAKAEMGTDGRVILTYGTGTPTIICALLKITEIDLAPGETIVKDGVDLGDSVEFLVAARHAGSGANAHDYLIIKPEAQDVETTMTVGTNRRVYYFRLRSTETKYMARIGFSYPEEEAKARQQLALALSQAQEAAAASLPSAATARKQGQLELSSVAEPPVKPWKYSLKKKGRDADYIVPLSVGDDGAHTHIQLPEEARTRGLPVLQIRDATGPIPANSHWDNTTLIVDALFEDGCLLEGVGRSQQKVCIHNEQLAKGKKHGSN
jgi:P-type conjugative transfer protein TrbG